MGVALDMARRYYDAFAAGDFTAATACFAADCPTVTPAGTMSPAEHEQFGLAFKRALPDAHMVIEKAVERENEIFIAGRFRGTHRGDLVTPQGTLPASGNQIDVPYADYFRVENGTVVEHLVYWDQAAMMGQLSAASR